MAVSVIRRKSLFLVPLCLVGLMALFVSVVWPAHEKKGLRALPSAPESPAGLEAIQLEDWRLIRAPRERAEEGWDVSMLTGVSILSEDELWISGLRINSVSEETVRLSNL